MNLKKWFRLRKMRKLQKDLLYLNLCHQLRIIRSGNLYVDSILHGITVAKIDLCLVKIEIMEELLASKEKK